MRALRIVRRVIGWTLAILLSLAVLALATVFIGVRTQPGARLLLRIGLGYAKELLAAKITVGHLRTNLMSDLVLEDVELRDVSGELAARIDTLTVRFSLVPLALGTLRVASVDIAGGRARVRSLSDGRVNFAALLRPRVPQPPRPDDPASTFRVEIHKVHAQLVARYEPPQRLALPALEGDVEVAGSVGIGGGDVTLQIDSLSTELHAPSRASLRGDGTMHIANGTVRFEQTKLIVDTTGAALRPFIEIPGLRGKYHLDLDAKGPLSALDMIGTLQASARPIQLQGQLRVGPIFGWRGHALTRDLDPEPLLLGAPHASAWLDVEAHGDRSRVRFDILHAQLQDKRNRVHASGMVELDRGLHADLRVDVDARELSTLKGARLPKLGGSVAGHVRLRYRPRQLRLDTELDARGLVLPWVRIGESHLTAQTENFGGHVLLRARALTAQGLTVSTAQVQLDGDQHTFLLGATALGSRGTSLVLGLRGKPRYGDGVLPVGISALLTALDVTRNGETWHAEPGATLVYDRELRVEHLRAHSAQQSFSVDGRYAPEPAELDATVHALGLDLNRLVALVTPADRIPHSDLAVALHAHGPIARLSGELGLTGTVTRNPALPAEKIHLKLDAHLDPARLSATGTAESPAGRIAFDGSLPVARSVAGLLASSAPVSLKLDASTRSLRTLYAAAGYLPPPALAALEGQASLSAALSGSARAPELHLRLSGEALRYGSIQHASLLVTAAYLAGALKSELAVSLGGDGKTTPSGRVSLYANAAVSLPQLFGRGSLANRLGRTTELDLGLRLEDVSLVGLPLGSLGVPSVQAGTLNGQLGLTGALRQPILHLRLSADGLRRGLIEGIDLRIAADSGRKSTQVTGEISVQRSPLLALSATLGLDLGTVLDGVSPRRASIDARCAVPGFDLSKLQAMIPGLTGMLSGKLAATGTLGAPSATAQLGIAGLAIGKEQLDTFALSGSYGDDQLKVALHAHEPRGGRLDGRLTLTGRALEATLAARSFAIHFESDGEELPVRRLRGIFDADLRAGGSLDQPLVSGSVGLTDTRLALVADPREITDMVLRLSIADGRLKLDTLTGKLGEGRFDVAGVATFAPPAMSVDLTVQTTQLPVLQHPLSVAVTSKLVIHGVKEGRTIKGTVLVEDGSAQLPMLSNVRNLQSTGALQDVAYVDTRGRAKAARELLAPPEGALELAVETKVPGPFHVRSKELQVDLHGDLLLTTKGRDVRLRGEVESLVGGRMQLLGKSYEIDHLRIGFAGRRDINPSLDIKITRELSQAVIGIEVNGTANDPVLYLSSQPPIYSDSQIVQAVLGGDPGQPTTDRGLDKKVTGAISGLIVGAIKNQLAPQLPIDVIKVDVGDSESPGVASSRLEIGKFLTDSIYLSYVHQFGTVQIGTRRISANRGDFEYRFRRHYAIDLSIGDAPSGKADLFWTLRY